MSAAPELSPTLDDAIVALDGALVRGVIDKDQLARVRGFLERLNEVRDVPPVFPDKDQAAILEGAYLAGYRCADESGHVLVVSLPALLAFAGVPAVRPTWHARFTAGLRALGGHVYPWGLVLMLLAVGLIGGGQRGPGMVAWAASVLVVFYSWAGSHAKPPADVRQWLADEAEGWKERAIVAEGRLASRGSTGALPVAAQLPPDCGPSADLGAARLALLRSQAEEAQRRAHPAANAASQVAPECALPSRRPVGYPPTPSGLVDWFDATLEQNAKMLAREGRPWTLDQTRPCCGTALEADHAPSCHLVSFGGKS